MSLCMLFPRYLTDSERKKEAGSPECSKKCLAKAKVNRLIQRPAYSEQECKLECSERCQGYFKTFWVHKRRKRDHRLISWEMQHVQNQDEVDDWSIGPRLSCSLHLDDIWNDKNVSSQSAQSAHSASSEMVDKNLSDKVKLFQLYVSACERNGSGLEDSDSSDDSIHHGRDSCASSRGSRDHQSHSTLDSFLLKPGRRSGIAIEDDLVSSTSRTSPAVNSMWEPSLSENFNQRPLLSRSFSGWPCQRTETPPAFGSFKLGRSRPQSGRPSSAHPADYKMYKTQVVNALSLGKPVWL
jgi:hypothetical protein